ncbi:hypothetical protein [Streptomyces sp. G45]|uniref:hypothetical protein n=1 Tax=Streptomyces sp. G45 TaxID=3406627 RepID=UPI003C16835F
MEPTGGLPRWAEKDQIAWVEWQVAEAIDAENGACRLLVGKSLGTLACGSAAERSLPAVWLTPLLTSSHVVDSLRRTTAPTLLVGGSADDMWDPQIADSLPHAVHEVPAADHALELPGDVAGSIDVLQRVMSRLDQFLGEIPTPPSQGRLKAYPSDKT